MELYKIIEKTVNYTFSKKDWLVFKNERLDIVHDVWLRMQKYEYESEAHAYRSAQIITNQWFAKQIQIKGRDYRKLICYDKEEDYNAFLALLADSGCIQMQDEYLRSSEKEMLFNHCNFYRISNCLLKLYAIRDESNVFFIHLLDNKIRGFPLVRQRPCKRDYALNKVYDLN